MRQTNLDTGYQRAVQVLPAGACPAAPHAKPSKSSKKGKGPPAVVVGVQVDTVHVTSEHGEAPPASKKVKGSLTEADVQKITNWTVESPCVFVVCCRGRVKGVLFPVCSVVTICCRQLQVQRRRHVLHLLVRTGRLGGRRLHRDTEQVSAGTQHPQELHRGHVSAQWAAMPNVQVRPSVAVWLPTPRLTSSPCCCVVQHHLPAARRPAAGRRHGGVPPAGL